MGAHLIVDGYNLARSGTLLHAEDPASREGRDALCGLLSEYARGKGFRLTVVYDGAGAERTRTPFKGGTALYAAGRESADDVIRELARGAPAGTVVVTSDRGLAGTLPRRNAVVVPCGEFAAYLAGGKEGEAAGDGDVGRAPFRGTRKKGEGRRPPKSERRAARGRRGL